MGRRDEKRMMEEHVEEQAKKKPPLRFPLPSRPQGAISRF
jgi:hypothetical protein